MEKTYTHYRRQIYASINGTKGNLVKLSKSRLLLPGEKEKLNEVIQAIENLRIEYSKNKSYKQENE